MTTPWTAPKQEIAPGEYERALKAQYAAARQRLWAKPKPKPVEIVESAEIVQLPAPEPKRLPSHIRTFRQVSFSGNLESDITGLRIDHSDHRKLRLILAAVAFKHGISVNDLKAKRRDRLAVQARHEAMWRVKNKTLFSLPKIGRVFGGRDHTTVLHAIRKHEARMAEEAQNA